MQVLSFPAVVRLNGVSQTRESLEKLQRVREYLGKAFEGYKVTEGDLSPSVRTFLMERDGRTYQLDIDETFLEREDPSAELERLGVREELCRAEGLPLVVSKEGVRLASSN